MKDRNAELINEDLLLNYFGRDERRLLHIHGVVNEAQAIGRHFPEVKDKLLEVAYLHDIGYSSKLVKTGFHPVDSAIFSLSLLSNEQVIKAVLFHSGAQGEASLVNEQLTHLYQQFSSILTMEDEQLINLITYCDIQTSPVGTPLSMEYRISEILSRYDEQHVVHKNIKSMESYFYLVRNKVLSDLQQRIGELPWVFLDVDNTLITPGGTTGNMTKQAISRYIAAGGKVSLVTGKLAVSINQTIKELGLEELPHISGNGSLIYQNGNTKVLHQLGGKSNALIKILDELAIPFCLYEKETIYYHGDHINAQHIDYLLSINEPAPIKVSKVNGDKAIKLLMFVDVHDSETRKKINERLEESDHDVFLVQTSPRLLEIMGMNQNKGNAIRELTNSFHHYYRFSIGVGDSENDLAMLNIVGKPYVVENASPQMKSYGFEELPCCTDEGVAFLLSKILNKGGFPIES